MGGPETCDKHPSGLSEGGERSELGERLGQVIGINRQIGLLGRSDFYVARFQSRHRVEIRCDYSRRCCSCNSSTHLESCKASRDFLRLAPSGCDLGLAGALLRHEQHPRNAPHRALGTTGNEVVISSKQASPLRDRTPPQASTACFHPFEIWKSRKMSAVDAEIRLA